MSESDLVIGGKISHELILDIRDELVKGESKTLDMILKAVKNQIMKEVNAS